MKYAAHRNFHLRTLAYIIFTLQMCERTSMKKFCWHERSNEKVFIDSIKKDITYNVLLYPT